MIPEAVVREIRSIAAERALILAGNETLNAGQQQRLESRLRSCAPLLRGLVTQDIADERGRVLGELDDLFRTAHEDGGRDLRADEWSRHNDLVQVHDILAGELAARTGSALAEYSATSGTVTTQEAARRHDRVYRRAAEAGSGRAHDPLAQASIARGTGQRTRRPGEVLVLERSESLVETLRPTWDVQPEELSFGRLVRSIVTGSWEGAEAEAEVMRAQSLAPLTSGGFLVPDQFSAQLIDLSRNAARVMRAGARTVPMSSATLHMGRVASDPTGAWLSENATASFSEGAYERITFEAKTLRAQAKISIELAEDSDGMAAVLEEQLSGALGLELDRAALRGTGVDPEPLGIRNHAGVTIDPLTGTPANYDFLSTAVQTIWEQNGEPNAVLYSARTAGGLDRLKDTTNQPLQKPDAVAALARYVTNQIPNTLGAGAESEAYVGAWSQLMIGMRTNLVLEAFRAAADDTGSSVSNFQIWIRAYLRADVQLAKPQHFVVVTEIAA